MSGSRENRLARGKGFQGYHTVRWIPVLCNRDKIYPHFDRIGSDRHGERPNELSILNELKFHFVILNFYLKFKFYKTNSIL